MTIKTSLLGSASLGLICALSMASAADAAAKHKASGEPSLAEQVKQLQATVESLEQTVQAQAAAQQQSQATTAQQLADAQARADAATAAAKSAQAKLDMQIQQIPGAVNQQVQTSVRDALPKPGNVKVTMGGFAAAETVYRSKQNVADIGSNFSKIPYENNALAHLDESRFTARQSRLSVLTQGDINPTTHAAFYGEFDFLGAAQTANSNESNSYNPRIRHVYGTIDWDDLGVHLLAGQNWSLTTMNGKGITPR
ncbi:MAG: hypothetical protein ACXWKO_10875, partial [Phenylobacterium sp.]